MEEVREELIKFKEYTEQLINSLKEDNIHLVPHFLEERQIIINSLSKKNIASNTYHEICKALGLLDMEKELQAFKSDEDWAKLFDDSLKSVISSACATLQKKEEDRKSEEIKKYAVKIPAKYAKQTPDMCLSEITIEISQRYSSRSIKVSNADGNYQIVYIRNSHMSPSVDR